MQGEAPTFLSLVISWTPMLILIGVWLYFMRNLKKNAKSKSGRNHLELLEEMVVETRRQNDLLEKMAGNMEERLRKLEDN